MSEVSMWLYPVAMAGAVGLFFAFRYGIKWTWGMGIQQLLILLSSALGFLCLYVPKPFALGLPNEDAAAFWAVLAWSLFAIFNIGQRIWVNKLNQDLALFRIANARQRLALVKILAWGPPAVYWSSTVDAMSFYVNNQPGEADAILQNWWTDPRLPQQAKESLVGFLMLGRVLLHDWRGIIDEFLKHAHVLKHSRSAVPYQMAMRACAELGEFDKSVSILEHANLATLRLTAVSLDINFMTLFALFGALDRLQEVFRNCTDKQALPDYARCYWLGRCYAVLGRTEDAVSAYRQAIQHCPADLHTWLRRTEEQLNTQIRVQHGEFERTANSAEPVVIERAYRLYSQCRLTTELVRPTKPTVCMMVMIVAICVVYVITNPDQFVVGFPELHSRLVAFKNESYAIGQLTWPGLLHGQWWRLITYMFLHGNTAHLLLNAGGLYIFGKSVENMYGTPKFLVIYVVSGILSGLSQVSLMPDDSAIGASGAILGIFGAAIAGLVKLKATIPPEVRKTELRWMISVAVAQVIFDQLVNNVAALTDKSPPGQGVRIASFAHLGGMVFGFLLGMLLPTKKWSNSSSDSDVNLAK